MSEPMQYSKAPSQSRMAAIVLLLCFVSNMIGRGFADTYIVFLLPVGTEFGWNRSQMSSVYSVYLLSAGLSAPLVGAFYQRFGPKVVYLFGAALLGSAYFVAGKLTHYWQFLLCVGLLAGVGVSSIGMVPAVSLINQWFRTNTSTAIGIAYAGYGCGTLIMVPLAQHLNHVLGWRSAYHIFGAGLLLLLPAAWVLPWRAFRAGPRAPPPIQKAPGAASPQAANGVRWTLLSAARTSGFWSLAHIFFFSSVAMYMTIVQTVAYLIDTGFAPIKAASAFGLLGLLSVACVTLTGVLCERIGFRRTAIASFISTFLGIAFLLSLSYSPTYSLLVGFVALFGISQGARGPIVSSLCGRLFPGTGLAAIYGALYACMSLGAATGSLLAGALYDLTGGYRASFIVSMGTVVLAALPFLTSAAINRVQGKHRDTERAV